MNKKLNIQNLNEEMKHSTNMYNGLVKLKNKPYIKYKIPEDDARNKSIDNLFIKNNYVIIDSNSNLIDISGAPILSPKIIIVGDFEQHCWQVKNSNSFSLLRGLLNKNLIDGVLCYGDSPSSVTDIKEIENYCKKKNTPFIYNDIFKLQSEIRSLKRDDQSYSNKIYNQNEYLSNEEFIKLQDKAFEKKEKVYDLFKKRAEHCAKEIEKNLGNNKTLVQLLTLEEVSNTNYISNELKKLNLPFVSYIPKDMPLFK